MQRRRGGFFLPRSSTPGFGCADRGAIRPPSLWPVVTQECEQSVLMWITLGYEVENAPSRYPLLLELFTCRGAEVQRVRACAFPPPSPPCARLPASRSPRRSLAPRSGP